MAVTKVCKGLISTSLVFLSLMAMQVNGAPLSMVAGADVPKSKVLLMATLNNGPAMQPVTWTVYRLQNGKAIYDRSVNLHSANIELEPGFYRADVTLDGANVSRSRIIDLSNVTSSKVIVAMD
ncbi:hypothetical protein [Thiothrix subterranea]|uniref:Uncharacterized protein n=1 Tax=Thiothrix subterranea TaxID=2735563 RepID=A0AA51MJN8_9GAMM|nr:hypothetical protein [Thiothrix subterranea]MDQ5770387.1 hypothetical protein [Thiothrix subterranea]WML85095.1 hypothetical protein RCG00_12345 [Thiothrix subterranea]